MGGKMISDLDYIALTDILLDYMTEVKGIRETIAFLMDSGFTREELIDLGFGEDDIWIVIHN
jgi:hypothetical protein